MAYSINGFEIPAKDFERAKAFYETVLGIRITLPIPFIKYAMFPADKQKEAMGGGQIEEMGWNSAQKAHLFISTAVMI